LLLGRKSSVRMSDPLGGLLGRVLAADHAPLRGVGWCYHTWMRAARVDRAGSFAKFITRTRWIKPGRVYW